MNPFLPRGTKLKQEIVVKFNFVPYFLEYTDLSLYLRGRTIFNDRFTKINTSCLYLETNQ